MAPARDGAGDDAAPVAPAERAGGSGWGGVRAVISVPWALVAVLFVLTAVFYEDAMELRMHARRAMFGDRAAGSVLLPRAFPRRGTPPTPPRGWELDAEDGTASPARKFGPADAATGWRDPPAADGIEAAPATTLEPPADDDSTEPAPDGLDDASSASASSPPPSSSPSLARPSRANDVVESAERAARGFVTPAGGASDPAKSRDAPPPPPSPPPLVENVNVRSAADLHPGGPVPLPDVDPSVGGEWRSLGRVRPMPNVDVTRSDDALREAAALRSFRREIIVMVSNRAGAHLAANSVAMLRRVGVEHYLLLTNAVETCEEIRAGPWGIQCGWTSYLMNHPRLAAYALTNEEAASPFRLWWARFHVLERLVAFGYNPMYVDTDVSFRYNPYPLLKGPFGAYQLVGQDETGRVTGVNIGFVYAQNATVGGGAHWVLNETVSRMLQILEHDPTPVTRWDGKTAEGAKEHLWDQHIYNDVLESAAFGRHLNRRSGQRLIDPEGTARDDWVKASGFPKDADLAWDVDEVEIADADVPTSPDDATERAPVDVGTHVVHVKTIRAIGGAGTAGKTGKTGTEIADRFLAAPAWFLGGWSGVAGDLEFQGVNGRWNLDPCPVVVAHLVGALSKQTTMKQLGWWAYGADAYRHAESLERSSTMTLNGVLAVRGLAAVGRREEDPAAAQEAYGLAIARIVELAVAAGRRPAIPALDCAAPWIARGSEFSFLGVRDREKIIVGARCDADSAAGGGGGYPDRAPARGDSGLGPCCASVNLGCDETAFVLQVDLDRDPRLQSAQDDVAYARWDSLPMTKDPKDPSGEDVFDGEALEAATKGPALLIVEMEEEEGGGGKGDEDEGSGEGAGGGRGRRRGELPATGRLTEAQRTRVEAFFRACGRVDCRPPRKPFPHDFSQCAAPLTP